MAAPTARPRRLERRAALPGGALRHRDGVPAPGLRGVRPQGRSRRSGRSTSTSRTSTRRSTAEFAHAVYRFGHSMLDDDVARTNEDPATGSKTRQLGAAAHGVPEPAGVLQRRRGRHAHTPEQAAGSIFMGSSDQAGNELDEFVTETLRNNLLGLPLDLPTMNMTRAREAGVPPLNDVRRQIFARDQRRPAGAVHELVGLRPAPQAPRVADQLRRGLRQAPDASRARRRWPASGRPRKAIVDPARAGDRPAAPGRRRGLHVRHRHAGPTTPNGVDHHRSRRRRPLGRRPRRGHEPQRRPARAAPSTTSSRRSWTTCRTATASTTWRARPA